jgi:voltage-gated potassium channel Kch
MNIFKDMPKVWRVIIVQILIIFVFAIIYYFIDYRGFNINFTDTSKDKLTFINYLYFSTVTSSTVGYGDIHPTNNITKIIVILQILISYTNILTILA